MLICFPCYIITLLDSQLLSRQNRSSSSCNYSRLSGTFASTRVNSYRFFSRNKGVMSLAIAILGAIMAIFSIIVLHELGHFFVAKACGIKVLRFSVGFGRAIWKRTGKSGTEFVLAWIPLGGYVKMLGEGEEKASAADAHRAFNQKPLLSRMLVVLAGPFTNFLIAIVAYWGVYLMGVTHVKPVIGSVVPHSIAARAGVRSGDELIKIDGVRTDNWQRVMMGLIMRMGDYGPMRLTVKPVDSQLHQERVLDLSSWDVDRRNPEFFKSLGLMPYRPTVPAVIAKVVPGSAAAVGGLKAGDRILSVNGHPVSGWVPMVKAVRGLPHQRISLTLMRNHQKKVIHMEVGAIKQAGFLGIQSHPPAWPSDMLRVARYSVFTAWLPAFEQTWVLTKFNSMVLLKMVTGKISIRTLGGPITVFRAAGKATQAGLQVYLGFLGFISLTIGFLNLLPIPGLDGGHLVFQIVEAIFRRPVPERYQMVGLSIGMVFLIFLMVQATINDLMRLF